MREPRKHLNRIFTAAVLVVAASAVVAGCGGDEEPGAQFDNEPAGDYEARVTSTVFPVRQTIAETYNLRIGVRNTGDKTIPAMNVTINLPGEDSTLAFAYRDEQVGLAQPQRPVWVLEEGYPKLAGTIGRGGAKTASKRTFNFGEVEAGDTANMVWRVTAVKPGLHRIAYRVEAGLGGDAPAVGPAGGPVGGFLPTRISAVPIVTKIDNKGKIVPLTQQERLLLEAQKRDSE